jgi:hypothetical protein
MMRQTALIVWASPGSLLGLTAGLFGLLSGGGMRRRGHTLEFHGGFVRWLLEHRPFRAAAMTLGHVIIGRSTECLDASREHELVHVRQYERWGPLFLPAYLSSSLYLWLRGRDAYLDNPFEREAYDSDRNARVHHEDTKDSND